MAFGRFGAWVEGQSQGSLLRRTLFHVVTFVVGSAAFVTIVSLVLVSVARGILPTRDGSDDAKKADSDSPASTTKPASKTFKPTKKATPPRHAEDSDAPEKDE